jgi:linoleoyl-CoA desaturase
MAAPSLRIESSDFAVVLRRRMDRFFIERNLPRKGDSAMAAKVVLGLLCFAGTYAALYLPGIGGAAFFALYILHGLAQLFLLLNIAHDSNHNAISSRRWIARPLKYVFDLCGISSYMWRVLHNTGHHSNINICGHDEDVIARDTLRYSPNTPWKPIHRYQHIYAWFLYGLSTIDYVVWKDLEYFFVKDYIPLREVRHPRREYAVLLTGKLIYFTYMLVLPVAVLHRPLLLVLGAFVAMHFVMGLIAQFIFQTTHVIETSRFPTARSEFENYTYHILATTADYATQSSPAKWLLGGLNHHVVHHLCPNVCHTHYPELTKIVRETAAQYRIPYREHATWRQALAEHVSLLKQLGTRA